MTYYRTLIDTCTLAGKLDSEDWRILDCRFDLEDASAGRRAWKSAHIPGAVHVDLETELSGRQLPGSGRHPLPERDELVGLVNELGISNDSQVVAYDDKGGAFAARLWWLLRWLGHGSVAVLDGGWQAWKDGGFPVSEQPVPPPRGSFVPHEPLVEMASADEILENPGEFVLVDARDGARFSGEFEPIDPVGGHIPGAINRPFVANLDGSGRFLPAARLQERFADIEGNVVHYCGSGVTACHNLLAMEVAGLGAGRLYPGSWSEWITSAARPVAVGND